MGPFSRTSLVGPSAAASSNRGRMLAIDYGRRHIGLAISDELGLTARPLDVLTRNNRREDFSRLREIVKANGIKGIVVGLPLHLSGKHSEMTEEAVRFAARVRKLFGLPVEMRDERLTSWEAEQLRKQAKNNKGASADSLAAAVVLREYLAERWARDNSQRQGTE